MTQTPAPPCPDAMPALGILPVHKRALGMAIGVVGALGVFLLTAGYLLHPPRASFDLILLRQYFAGYSVSWGGALIGAAWGGFVGFIAGWFLAFSRNLLMTILVAIVRSRARLIQTRDFLDHI